MRRAFPPESPGRTLSAATWGGLAQFLLFALVFFVQLKAYFLQRGHQLAPHMVGTNEVIQAGAAVIVVLEYLLHPLAVFLLYLSVEGLIRFMAGLVAGQVVPNLLVFLFLKAGESARRLREQRRDADRVPDTIECLPDGRIRIAAARPKSTWNASITIGVNGEWFEVEHAEQGVLPRNHIYFLRRSPLGKVLRGYEEYDASSAVSSESSQGSHAQEAGALFSKNQ